MARRQPHAAQRLRFVVEALPARTRVAMLEGIDRNRIVVGAYADPRSGGICPMLAAHRNGGRTSLASFARAWDRYTGAKRPRLATRRELRVLRSYLEMSLLTDEQGSASIAELARRIRTERDDREPAPRAAPNKPGDSHRGRELRDRLRWAWLRPARRLDDYRDLLAAAEEQLAEQRATDILGEPGARLASRPH